jgi:gamma-glutamyl:cysteine ligase YbdK (ATP-grasp superfamily)
MSIQFNKSDGPSLGVEVELQIVDLESRMLVSLAPELLAAVDNPEHIKAE